MLATLDPRRLALKFLISAASVWVADLLVDGITIGDWTSLLILVVALGIANAVARPVLKALTCPMIVLTLGLFLLVINTVMLAIAAWLSGQVGADVTVDGVGAAFLGALIISLVGWGLSMALD